MSRTIEKPAPIVTHRIETTFFVVSVSRQGDMFALVTPHGKTHFPRCDAMQVRDAFLDLLENYETATA